MRIKPILLFLGADDGGDGEAETLDVRESSSLSDISLLSDCAGR